MAASDPYFQFPLCLLALGYEWSDLLNRIITFGLMHVGRSAIKQDGESKWRADPEEMVEMAEDELSVPLDYDHEKEDHRAVVVGCHVCDVVTSYAEANIEQASVTQLRVQKWDQRFGRGPTVRIRSRSLFRIRDKKSMSEREFRVLCAVYSKIGNARGPVRMKLDEVRIRASGFKSQKNYEEAGQPVELLTSKRIRKTLDDLWVLGFFSRFSTGNATYYQHRARCSNEELAVGITEKRLFRQNRLDEQRVLERAMHDRVKRTRQPEGK